MLRSLIYTFKMVSNEPAYHLEKLILYAKNLIYSMLRFKVEEVPVAIYTLGKSGSSSIYNTLKREYSYFKVHQLNFIDGSYLRENHGERFARRNIDRAQKFLNRRSVKGKKIKYITLVREPLSRDISSFYQNRQLYFQDVEVSDYDAINDLIETRGYDLALNWFDYEMKHYLDFDIYSKSFNKQRGYSIYQVNDKAELLVLRTDKINDVAITAINEFLNIDIKGLVTFNVSDNKSISNHQKQLKSQFRLSKTNHLKITNSKFMNHFFTEEEIEQYYKDKI